MTAQTEIAEATRNDSSLSATLTRRGFVKLGGALFVSFAVSPAFSLAADESSPAGANPPDPSLLSSWLEIRSDNSILLRTGRAETGTGMSGYYAQVLAEELRVRPETITLLMGDTDETPDGGFSAGFLYGADNVRKVGAYTYEALLGLAAAQLQAPVNALSVSDGTIAVAGQNKAITYGQLVQGQQLDLKISGTAKPLKMDPKAIGGVEGLFGFAVAGEPKTKPVSEYKVVGSSFPMPGIPDKVTGKTQWSCDVTLPGMLHARMVRPATLGSTLVSVGTLDKNQFPTAQVVTKGNFVAVVSPNEWESIGAARALATTTKWTDWSGLPGNENLTKALRAHDWGAASQSKGKVDEVNAAMARAAKTVSASYELPYVRHAPIGPFLAVADVRTDGKVTVWTHSSQSQGLRTRIAHSLGTSIDNVVVRWLVHSGQYGRTTFGGDGAESDAVLLSQLTGKPVRVQWTLQDDLAWSSCSPGWVSDIKAGLDSAGNIVALHSACYSPTQSDPRMLGAILAGNPSGTIDPGGWIATEWPYDKISNRLEEAFGMTNLAADSPYGGLRGNIMRTPGQRQQNFTLENLMNEAAASAKIDPVQFRLNHTTDSRLIDILNATAKAANWDARPSPHRNARRNGTSPLTGRGVSIMIRANAYWVGIAEISIVPATGVVTVTRFFIGAECGKVINPRQLDRCMKSGVVMGLSEALKEEVTFDKSKVTSTNWSRYKILTMEETPEIKVVQISRDDKGFGGGSEAANAVVPPAVAAAIFDATGVAPRKLPQSPAYIKALLQT